MFLDLAPDSIYQRLKADPSQLTKRPLLMNLSDNELIEKLKKLREDRIEKYLAAGKLVILMIIMMMMMFITMDIILMSLKIYMLLLNNTMYIYPSSYNSQTYILQYHLMQVQMKSLI